MPAPGSSTLVALILASAVAVPGVCAKTTPDFQREIRPILSNNCFKCHGPDEKERKGGKEGSGGLRLDTEEGSRADLDGIMAIVPGQPEKSELIARITTTDKDDLMPPSKSGKKLTPHEIELLTAWIKSGGTFARHWSYEKPIRVQPPKPAENPIDAFILARLEKEGLNLQPEAPRTTLIRRLALDLTGLPPTVEEVDAFVNDPAPDAYARLVERLLASPAYGEHWARTWLDLSRYADSAGYADDPPRTIWAFRDYVIRAFNTNKPFDQFSIEQLAGDLLPNPTEEQLIATAFHRNTMTNNEGGTQDEEFRNAAVVDRVNTTMAVWMGTSIACAQCHTHKYDPISQTEYFRLFAFFNNTEDADRKDETPLLTFFSDEQKARRGPLEADFTALDAKFKTSTPALVGAADKWAHDFPAKLDWQVLTPATLKSQAGLVMKPVSDGAVLVPATAAKDTYTVELPFDAEQKITALRLEALPHDSLPGKGPGHAGGNFVVTRVRAVIQPPNELKHGREIRFSDAVADFVQADFDEDLVVTDAVPKEPKRGRKKRGPQKGWAIGGSPGVAHNLTLLAAEPINVPAGAKLAITIEQQSSSANHTLGHFRLAATHDPRVTTYVQTPSGVIATLGVPAEQRDAKQREQLISYYVRDVAPELAADREKLATLRKQIDAIAPNTVPIFRELGPNQRRKTRLQLRGNYRALADEVTEGVPAAFPPLPPDAPMNRLTLARWLFDENNPLTARVIANRFWETIFGIGLVRTSEEFGAQGELPSHPELLDWLATELVRQKWDVKKFLTLLVTSATYRQSSKVTPELFERDPDNRLLARGPRFRMSAEMVRDQALAVSGLYSQTMYGPSVRPVRPALGLAAAFGGGLDWQASAGDDKHRRALYTEWRRTSPYPSMVTFDAPNREVCTLRRNRTNTPLQALVTMNDPVYVEAAQALARRMIDGATLPVEQASRGFRAVLARTPSDQELQRLIALHDDALAFYKQDTKKAAEMATNPIGPAPAGADVAELAAWTTVASVLLNLDETLMKR